MGRRIPLENDPLIHPTISIVLLAAGTAAAIAIITTLCGVRFRKKSPLNPSASSSTLAQEKADGIASPPANTSQENLAVTSPPQAATSEGYESTTESTDLPIRELPLPPAIKQLKMTHSCNNFVPKSASSRNLTSTLSVKVSRSMSMARNRDREHKGKKGKMKSEDTIWMKTIILGEKCKVPDEEDDAVVYDGQGKRISTYHPKSSSSFSPSRTNSRIDQSAIPTQEKRKRLRRSETDEYFDANG